MTEQPAAGAANDVASRPPGERLHNRLARLSLDAETHRADALRVFAQLRRGQGRFGASGPADSALLGLLGPLDGVGGEAAVDALLDDAMLVAWLVATARPRVAAGWGDRPSFGADFRPVRLARDSASIEQLMNRLLASSRTDLDRVLRRAVPLLAATRDARTGQPGRLDVAALMRDLADWSREDRRVQRRWARDFWFVPPKKTDGELTPAATAFLSTPDAGR